MHPLVLPVLTAVTPVKRPRSGTVSHCGCGAGTGRVGSWAHPGPGTDPPAGAVGVARQSAGPQGRPEPDQEDVRPAADQGQGEQARRERERDVYAARSPPKSQRV